MVCHCLFSNLKWWIKGISVPNKPTTGLLTENKLTKEFSQDGWIIQLDDYKKINDQLLPMKIAMRRQKKLAHIKNTFMGILDSDKN